MAFRFLAALIGVALGVFRPRQLQVQRLEKGLCKFISTFSRGVQYLDRTDDSQAASNALFDTFICDKVFRQPSITRRNAFNNLAWSTVAFTTGTSFITFAAHRDVAGIANIFWGDRAGGSMCYRVQIANITPRTGPVFTTLTQVKESALGFFVSGLAHVFGAAEFFTKDTFGRTGIFVCYGIGRPARTIARAFPPLTAFARVKERTFGFGFFYLAAIFRFGR